MMNRRLTTLLVVASTYVFMTLSAFGQSFTADEIKGVIKAFGKYDYAGDPTPVHTIEEIIRFVGDKDELRAVVEQEMISLLLSDATFRAKQFVCHQLWIIGTDKSVGVLEKMLVDKDTVEIACYALGTNPSPAATRALRRALNRADSAAKLRFINILGDRHDKGSVDQLLKLLESDNASAAQAAAISLGSIGTDKGIAAIKKMREEASGGRRAVLTRALLRGAEYYAKNGRMADAMAIYERLFEASEPLFVRRSALVGALSTGDSRAVVLLEAALDQDVAVLSAAAIANSGLLDGDAVAKKLIAAMKHSDASGRVLIIESLAGRGGSLVRDAISAAVAGDSAYVRLAAFNALGDVGDAASAVLLCSALPKARTDAETKTILASLRRMAGDGVDEAIAGQLASADLHTKADIIAVVSDRGYRHATKQLLKACGDKNALVARAAVKAVGVLGTASDLSALTEVLAVAEDSSVRNEAVRAVIKLAREGGDTIASAGIISGCFDNSGSTVVRAALLRILATLPCEASLRRLTAALDGDEAMLRDAAVRCLGQYPDSAAAKILLGVFKTAKTPTRRVMALRGMIRLCKTTEMDALQKISLYGQAMAHASTAAEKKLILSGIAETGHPAAIDLVTPLLDDAAVKTEAALTLKQLQKNADKRLPAK